MDKAAVILSLTIFLVAAHVPAAAQASFSQSDGPPQDECMAPALRVCVSSNCGCVAPITPGEASNPSPKCALTVGYAVDRPDVPTLYFSHGECALNADIALAVSLASLLKMTMPATPAPKR